MSSILHGYDVNDPTWFYLSSLLIVAVFFRFNRVWSLRNFDLLLLLSISPGLLFLQAPDPAEKTVGYIWLFVGTGIFLARLFCDPLFKRRPLLEHNMNAPGLAFLGIAVLAFLMTKVVTEEVPDSTRETVRRAEEMLNRQDSSKESIQPADVYPGVATRFLAGLTAVPTSKLVGPKTQFENIAARILVILAHLGVVCGLILAGKWHLGDMQLGLGMATLYLLLPCTSYDVGKVNHVLPAALIVWAFVAYRRPMAAGGLMGLACGTLFFPIFLLPLWAAFYGRQGALRFGMALGLVGAVLLGSLLLTSADTLSFTRQTVGAIDWSVLKFQGSSGNGFWRTHNAAYRVPVIAFFFVMLGVLTFYPWRKNLEHLMAYSAAIVVATQLWYPQHGGAYLLWYMPLMMMVVFRPRLLHSGPPELKSEGRQTKKTSETARPGVVAVAGRVTGQLFR